MGGLLGSQLPSVQHWSGTENSPTRTPKKQARTIIGEIRRSSVLAIPKIVFYVLTCAPVCVLMRASSFALQNSLN